MSEEQKLPAPVIFNSNWSLSFDWTERDRDQYVIQGFVSGPGRSSASLNFALECGTTSCDKEIPIPKSIMAQLEKYKEYA
jgi:hypothetical protein